MTESSPSRWGIPDTYVFDLETSRRGYPVNKMCNSLKHPGNREAFKQDEEAYMEKYGLSEDQKQAIRDRDWLRLTQLGGNLFFFLKLGATLGYGLYTIGAQMRGESYEQFMSTRNVPGAT